MASGDQEPAAFLYPLATISCTGPLPSDACP
jgi:hypothetical protein